MTKIFFTQSVSKDGQIVLALASTDLPAGSFNFQLSLAYTGTSTSTQFNNVKFSGSSAVSVSSSGVNSSGTVNISGSLSPTAGGPFATLSFDAKGSGVFNADITSLKISSVSPAFTDPSPFSYTIVVVPLIDTIALSENSGISGVFDPYNSFFPSVSITDQPNHGTATFSAGSFAQPQWTYTPAANFYGADSFTILVRDGGNSKEKTIVLNVSPVGTDSNDVFVAGKGVLAINGQSGMDTLIASGAKTNYIIAEVVQAGVTRYVVTDKTATDGTNTLTSVERIKFTDTSVALDINGNAGQAYRIYKAALDRTPDLKGLGDWIYALDTGLNTLKQVADGFTSSAEFQGKYGVNTSNESFITLLYNNVLGRKPDATGLADWQRAFDLGSSRADVLIGFSESPENQANVIGLIANGIQYDAFVG